MTKIQAQKEIELAKADKQASVAFSRMLMVGIYVAMVCLAFCFFSYNLRKGLEASPAKEISKSIAGMATSTSYSAFGISVASIVTTIKRFLQFIGFRF